MTVIKLSDEAAAFLLGAVRHLNSAKTLPRDNSEALRTSAWLEEIEAALVSPRAGAVSDRDALLTYIHRSDHLGPAEGCRDCAAVLDALDLYRAG